jgi:hypothetical protein
MAIRRDQKGRFAQGKTKPASPERLPEIFIEAPVPSKWIEKRARLGVETQTLYYRYRQTAPGEEYEQSVCARYRPNTVEELEKVIASPQREVRILATYHELTTPQMKETLSNDEWDQIRENVACCKDLSLATQRRLARDPSKFVRRAMLYNDDLPEEIVSGLLSDSDHITRNRARKHPNAPSS